MKRGLEGRLAVDRQAAVIPGDEAAALRIRRRGQIDRPAAGKADAQGKVVRIAGREDQRRAADLQEGLLDRRAKLGHRLDELDRGMWTGATIGSAVTSTDLGLWNEGSALSGMPSVLASLIASSSLLAAITAGMASAAKPSRD